MKKWEAASIEALNIEATAQGGANANKPDANWKDQYNNLWTSYASGDTNTPVSGGITVTSSTNNQ